MGPILFGPGGTPWGNLFLTFHIIFVFILSSIINHHSSLINHQSSIISHQSSVINHQSSMINDQSSVINHHTIWVPGILGPGALGSRGPEPWDPGAWSPGIPGPGALGSRGPAIPFYTFSSRNRSGIGFLSSRIAGNDRLGLGNSKIEVLAKNSKKSRGNQGGKSRGNRGGPPPGPSTLTRRVRTL